MSSSRAFDFRVAWVSFRNRASEVSSRALGVANGRKEGSLAKGGRKEHNGRKEGRKPGYRGNVATILFCQGLVTH